MSARMSALRSVAALALACAGVLSACADDRATVTELAGPPAYGFILLSAPGTGSRNLPNGQAVFARPFKPPAGTAIDSVLTIRLGGLDTLTTGFYQVWVGLDSPTVESAQLAPATGTLRVIRTDSTLNAEGDVVATVDTQVVPGVSSFQNGGPATRIELVPDRLPTGQSAVAATLVLVTVETTNAATTPGTVQPLWIRRTGGTTVYLERPNAAGTGTDSVQATTTSAAVFGNFSFTASQRYVFTAQGRGRAAVRGNEIVVTDSNLARPPIGYFYSVNLTKRDEVNRPIEPLALGDLKAPAPDSVSLRNADVEIVHPVVQVRPPSIVAASNRLKSTSTAPRPFEGYADVLITLESKFGPEDVISPTTIMTGNVPDIVRLAPATP